MPTNKPRRIFLDTNVLVYDADLGEPTKKAQATQLLQALFAMPAKPVISTQVLNEYVNITTRKLKPALPLVVIQATVAQLCIACSVITVTSGIILDAFWVMSFRSVSWWDALLHAAAVAAGVTDVLSEDLVHLGTLDNITYHDPFDPSFDVNTLITP